MTKTELSRQTPSGIGPVAFSQVPNVWGGVLRGPAGPQHLGALPGNPGKGLDPPPPGEFHLHNAHDGIVHAAGPALGPFPHQVCPDGGRQTDRDLVWTDIRPLTPQAPPLLATPRPCEPESHSSGDSLCDAR